jgi:HEAT repeat protein
MGLFGPPDVGKLKAKGDIGGLVKALTYAKDASIRCKAVLALKDIGNARVVEPLIGALNDHAEVRPSTARRK